jgi:peptide/nickel transport system substrate-binding protein
MWFKANKNWLIVTALVLVAAVPAVLGFAQVKNPDTFVYSNIGQPDSLDPAWAFDTASYGIIQNVYEALVNYKGGSTAEFVPGVAGLPTISADGLTYTFTVRSDVKFHDGSALTGEDVAYTFQRLLVIDRVGGSGFLHTVPLLGVGSTRDLEDKLRATVKIGGRDVPLNEAICGAVTASGNTVTFRLAKPFAPYLQIIAGGQSHIVSKSFTVKSAADQKKEEFKGCPLSKEDLAKLNNPENESKLTLNDVANGTGPFKLVSWDKAQKVVTLTRNDAYWGTKASFKNVISKEVPEFTARLLELQNGDADMIDAGARANVPQILELKDVLVVDDMPSLSVNVFNFNFDVQGDKNPLLGSGACDGKGIPKDFFIDKNVRLGFAHSFDSDKFIRDIQLGKAFAPATPNIKGLPYFDANVKRIPYNREEARKAFGAAKCGTAANAPTLNSVGFTLTIRYNTGNVARQAAANLLKTDIESFNTRLFKINVEGVPFSEILNQLDKGELPAFVLGWLADYVDDADFIDQWMGSSAHGATFSGPASIEKLPAWGTPGKTKGGVEYKNWDELLDKGINATDPNVRRDIYSHLQQLYVDNAVGIPLFQGIFFSVQRTWLNGWYYNPAFPSGVYPTLNLLSKKDGAKPDADDICKNYPDATFNYGGGAGKKDCKNKP